MQEEFVTPNNNKFCKLLLLLNACDETTVMVLKRSMNVREVITL